jgi:hypothetical protein
MMPMLVPICNVAQLCELRSFKMASYKLAQLVVEKEAMTTAKLLRQRLELILDWYRRMVNAETGMLGCFGMSVSERAQRIDVTGHAASAFLEERRKRG